MLSMLWLAALSPLAHAECADVARLIENAEQAVVESRTEDAGATLRQAEAALSCSPVPSPALLARMWLAEGTRSYMEGDTRVAGLAFAAAARVAPEVWVESYGPQVRQVYQSSSGTDSGQGTVRVHPNPQGWVTSLDGTQVSFPVEAAAGLHVVQVGRSAQRSEYAEVFFLPRAETYFIMTGLEDTPIISLAASEPTAPEPTAPEPALTQATPEEPTPLEAQPLPTPGPTREGFSSPVFLVLGGAAAALAGGAAVAAVMQDPQMESAVNIEALDRSFARQKSFAYASYGAAGVAAASLGLHFALRF